ncbi:hypothetical protein HPB50_014543 [Hyalomma asiaticum]|uniref:Uncharacterized protein n=1 Tax=Hyalomma asiaticum TaxID=266040 RepID=A0ACB7TIQ6_HYAAI|nr:hypothetical protein HPB50_014543 [Hyalomma asiaticum]
MYDGNASGICLINNLHVKDVIATDASQIDEKSEIPCFFEEFPSTFSEESPSHEEPSSASLSDHRVDAEGDVCYATRQLVIEDVLPDDIYVAAKPWNKADQLLQRGYLIDVGTKDTVYHRSTARHSSTVKGGRYRVVVLSRSARHSHVIRSSACVADKGEFARYCTRAVTSSRRAFSGHPYSVRSFRPTPPKTPPPALHVLRESVCQGVGKEGREGEEAGKEQASD